MNPKQGGRPNLYPLAARLQAKALYLSGRSYQEIESLTKIPREFLRKHQNREGWAKLRQSPEHRNAALDTLNKELAEFQAAVAVEAQSLTLDAMPLARAAIDEGKPRDFKDAAMGIKTMLEVSRLAAERGESKGDSAQLGGVNLFFFSGKAERIEKPVTPVVAELARRVVEDPEF